VHGSHEFYLNWSPVNKCRLFYLSNPQATTAATIYNIGKQAGQYYKTFYDQWNKVVYNKEKLDATTDVNEADGPHVNILSGGTCSCYTCSGHGTTYREEMFLPRIP
jgi:hypothetical protein